MIVQDVLVVLVAVVPTVLIAMVLPAFVAGTVGSAVPLVSPARQLWEIQLIKQYTNNKVSIHITFGIFSGSINCWISGQIRGCCIINYLRGNLIRRDFGGCIGLRIGNRFRKVDTV